MRTLLLLVPLLLLVRLPAQNSMKKERLPPTAVAARAGSAVQWRGDLDQALADSKSSGKPVFWYVPSVSGSPMDRKPEIDRYLLAGPFSWPSTIELLNQHFVPVKSVAKGERQQQYKLQRLQFIEPGWLVLDGDGKELLRLDQITTFQPQWFEAPLRTLVHAPADGFPGNPALREAWEAYRIGDRAAARARADAVLQQHPSDGVAAEARYLAAASLCRDRQRAAGVQAFAALAAALPQQPLAWAAAMEAEGHGPFVHGFADFLPLPPAVLASAPTDGSRAPASTYTEPQLWQRSVDFLLAMDDGDGVIRDSIYDFGGTDSLPNVYAAVSCIAGAALLEARTRQQHGQLELGSGTGERIEAMLERLLTGGCNDQLLCRTDRDEILWAYTYRIRLLSRWITLRPADKQRLLPPLQQAVDALTALQPDSGMWFHEYGNPFASATALQSLKSGSDAGAVVERARIDTGLRALLHCRTKVGAFTYGDPGQGEPKAGFEGAAGRMPLCELALACWGKSGADALQQALGKGFEHHGLLAHVRKYDDHADQYHYGGFFFWFDMLGRTEAVMALPAGEARDKFQAQQRQIVLDLPEFDGCFVDSHELGRAYGTAMALLCLAALRP